MLGCACHSSRRNDRSLEMYIDTPMKRVRLTSADTGTVSPYEDGCTVVTPASSQGDMPTPNIATRDLNPTPSPPNRTPIPSFLSKDEIKQLLRSEAGYDCDIITTPKRTNYLTWDDYFMAVAFLSAQRSKDPTKPVGACIVDEANRVIGIGYNGFPRGCDDDALPWTTINGNWLHSPNPYVCHAEVNAILNKCSDATGARLYVPQFPCNECAKVIVQAGIKEVIYMNDSESNHDIYKASRILFTMAGVCMRKYVPLVRNVELDFSHAIANETKTIARKCGVAAPGTSTMIRHLLLKEANWDPSQHPSTKRSEYLTWDDYFMAMAFLTARRSKDPNTQVGACIVDSSKCIVGLGYNGFPRGCSDDHLPWGRLEDTMLHNKYAYVCHAEVNAILNKCSANVKGATLYVALFPCNECAKMIIQAGIREVVYMADTYHDTDMCRASRIMFQMAGVILRQHIPDRKQVNIVLEQENPES